jgi:glycosyltransferase involved in cell wall biosynthesis
MARVVNGSSERIRVTYAIGGSLPSTLAAPIQILRTCRALCDLGVEVQILTGRLTEPVDECLAFYDIEPHENLELVAVPSSGRMSLRRRQLVAALEPARSGPHVVVSRGKAGALLFRELRRLDGGRGRLHVYEVHRPCSALVSRAGWHRPDAAFRSARRCRLEREAVRWADGLVCITDSVRDELDALHGVTCPVLILPSGTSVSEDPPPGDERRNIDVVFAGKISQRKGIELVLEAMRFLPGRRACVVGGAPERIAELRRLAASLGVSDRVTLSGFLPPARIPDLLRRARVAVCPLPSGDGGAGRYTSSLKLLEAMANGAPVVASDLPAIRSQVEDGRTALLVAPDDPEGLADGIRTLLEDRRLAVALARNAFTDVRRFSWEKRAERLLYFLMTLAEQDVAAGAGRARRE